MRKFGGFAGGKENRRKIDFEKGVGEGGGILFVRGKKIAR